jgi:energy-coupling factor transporter ATP-binding protein EcfA2
VKEFNEINEAFADPDADFDKLLERQAIVQEKMDATDAWNLDSRLEMAMDALRCPPGDTPVSVVSGGERRRIALCRLLLQNPDILLLDEPTNHLDAESVAWLERYLQNFPGTVIAVTHDRYFLDHVAGWILELDRGRGIPWKGNYSSWLEQKEKRLALEVHEELFQPFHCLKVEVVGRFVEQERICASREHAGQLGAFAPATGKLAKRQKPLLFGEAKAGKHGLGALFGVVAVAGLKIVLASHEAGHSLLVTSGLGLFPFLPEIAPVGERGLHPLQKRHIERIFAEYLLHIADAAFAGDDDAAAVGRSHASHHAQERRLAGTVRAADAKAHAVHDIQ